MICNDICNGARLVCVTLTLVTRCNTGALVKRCLTFYVTKCQMFKTCYAIKNDVLLLL